MYAYLRLFLTIEEYDLRDTDAIERAVKHSDTVYNLIGREWETKYRISLRLLMKGTSNLTMFMSPLLNISLKRLQSTMYLDSSMCQLIMPTQLQNHSSTHPR